MKAYLCNAEKYGYRQVDIKTAMHLAQKHNYDILNSSNVRSNKAWVKPHDKNNTDRWIDVDLKVSKVFHNYSTHKDEPLLK